MKTEETEFPMETEMALLPFQKPTMATETISDNGSVGEHKCPMDLSPVEKDKMAEKANVPDIVIVPDAIKNEHVNFPDFSDSEESTAEEGKCGRFLKAKSSNTQAGSR